MSEETKSLAQIDFEAFDAAYSETIGILSTSWEDLPAFAKKANMAGAQAVAARVREECARIADELAEEKNRTAKTHEWNFKHDEAKGAQDVAEAIRAMNEASHE